MSSPSLARARSIRSSASSAAAPDEVRDAVDLSGADVVENRDFGTGCSSSIAVALGAVDPRCDVLVLMLGDQPGVRAATVAALLEGRGDAPLAGCRYDNGRGHPLAFARGTFAELGALHGDKGVWKLLDRRARDVVDVPIAGPVPLDVDTWEEYEAVLKAPAHDSRGRDRPARARRGDTGPASRPRGLPCRRGPGDVHVPRPAPAPAPVAGGQAGVGKTEAAKSLAAVLDTPLIRLQCYEGIDAAEALYEWNYPRQLLSIRLADSGGSALSEEQLFGRTTSSGAHCSAPWSIPVRGRRCC